MSEELIKITQLIAVGFSGISFGVALGNVVWSFANYKELKKNLREIEERNAEPERSKDDMECDRRDFVARVDSNADTSFFAWRGMC